MMNGVLVVINEASQQWKISHARLRSQGKKQIATSGVARKKGAITWIKQVLQSNQLQQRGAGRFRTLARLPS